MKLQAEPGRRISFWACILFLICVAAAILAVGASLDYALYTFLLS